MQSISAQQIEKLDDTNYESWRIQMKSVLRYNDLWGYVAGQIAKTEANAQAWTIKDEKALDLIILSVKKNQLNHIKRAETSSEAWNALKNIYESRGPMKQWLLYRRLYKMRKEQNQGMTQYIDEFIQMVEKLEETDITLPQKLIPIMLLNSLPSDYEIFCIAIASRETLPTIDELKIKLIEEETRKKEHVKRPELDGEDALLSNKKQFQKFNKENYSKRKPEQNYEKKFNGKCYICGKIGHKSNVCRNKSKIHGARSQREEAMISVALGAHTFSNTEWCLDSGASTHMCNDRRKYIKFKSDDNCKINTASGDAVDSTGKGEIKLCTKKPYNEGCDIKLSDVRYVPDFRSNLLSISNITDNGYTVTFNKNSAKVLRKNGSIALTAKRKDRLYVVEETTKSNALLSSESRDDSLIRWHHRLGHLNFHDLRKLQDKDLVKGINIKSMTKNPQCEICDTAKIHQLPFKSSETRTNEVLGLVHTDICGPMKTTSFGGARYFATFIDDKTRKVDVVILKNRSDILHEFQKYKTRVEKETEKQIKILRSDNAKEYVSKEFTAYLEKEGISRQLSIEYTPQQNGVAERMNRTLVESARCMLIQSGLPEGLWAEAISTAAYVRNRCPTKSLTDMTPIESWSGIKPYIGYMRAFGSQVIALEKNATKSKFAPRGQKYILIGYSETSKAYRLWDPHTRKIVKRRDVRFYENLEKETIHEKPQPEILEINIQNVDAEIDTNQNDPNENVNENDTDAESIEENSDNEDNVVHEVRRKPGRPKIIRTGRRGRPRKSYRLDDRQCVSSDPTTVEEAMSREDRDA